MMNKGVVYALWDYEAQNSDELAFHEGDAITILRRKDDNETEWWWARLGDREGYVPKNLLGVRLGARARFLMHRPQRPRQRGPGWGASWMALQRPLPERARAARMPGVEAG